MIDISLLEDLFPTPLPREINLCDLDMTVPRYTRDLDNKLIQCGKLSVKSYIDLKTDMRTTIRTVFDNDGNVIEEKKEITPFCPED